jgi:tetratricopeptide (TPR) repeat protein
MGKKDSSSNFNPEFLLTVARFEETLAGNISVYFEGNEVEEIIDYYINKTQFLKAIYACDYAIEKFPFSHEFYSIKAEVFIYLEKVDEAIVILEYQISMGNADHSVFSLFGDAYLLKEEYNIALKYYKKAMDCVFEENEKEDTYFDIAFVYQSMEQYTLAIKYLLKTIRINPKHPEAVNELGICIDLSEEFQRGLVCFEEIINLHPYCDAAWFFLGHCYAALGRNEKAANAYEYAVIINEKNELAQFALADILFELGKYQDSLEIFQMLEREGDQSDGIYKKIGLCYYHLEEISEAKAYYNKGIKTCISDEFSDELWYLLGEAFEAEDNYESAKKCYETALDKYNSEIYWAALAYVEQELGNYETALKYYENAIEGDPYNEALWEAYAYCLMDNEDFEKAVEVLESGLVIMPKSANLRYLLGGAMIKGGSNQQGNVELEKALTMNYQEHETIFEYFPELRKNHSILKLIEQYKK